MPPLAAKERAALPDRAFAYIDSQGRRRLPIHDAAHVRNALVRFGQVAFEDEKAREQARLRLLNAAKKFKIVPVGFIAGQLQQQRAQRDETLVQLPSGFVTMLMTDIEGSTAIVQRLGERYRDLIDGVWDVLRHAVANAGGHEVEARADEFFAVFESPRDAVDAAIALQQTILNRTWVDDLDVRVRVGIHSGYPTSTSDNYIGMDVHTASRICSVGHGGQVVVSANTREGVKASAPHGVQFKALGAHRLRGLPELVELYQVAAKGLPSRFPPLRT
ncbi:MAG TPA: adenylate/guanylate cyclase domain-containing protein [Ilumatobacteraceae bacterium]|jgi:class 3 adenylate cyclase